MALARQSDPDVVVARLQGVDWAGVWLARSIGVPLVLEVNAPVAYEAALIRDKAVSRFYEHCQSENWREADRITAVSRELRDHIVSQGVASQKVVVNPNGVAVDRLDPRLFDAASVIQEYHINAGSVVGFTGTLRHWQGVQSLLKAFVIVTERIPRATLLVVGGGPEAKWLRKEAEDLGVRKSVRFVGWVDHNTVPRFLSAMDVCVAPYEPISLFYFSPIKVLEYMAMGKAIVASRQGQIVSLVEGCGSLFEPGQVAMMAEQICDLLQSPSKARRLGNKARRKVLTGYSWIHNARRVCDVLTEVSR
jgi:glycosyltransferase involved in cell wall biosynthesis